MGMGERIARNEDTRIASLILGSIDRNRESKHAAILPPSLLPSKKLCGTLPVDGARAARIHPCLEERRGLRPIRQSYVVNRNRTSYVVQWRSLYSVAYCEAGVVYDARACSTSTSTRL